MSWPLAERAMPTLAETNTSPSSSSKGSARAARVRSAASRALPASATSSKRMVNSSPPKRATVSPGRTESRILCGHRPQQLVPAVVAHAVVDELEVVEIEEDHSHVAGPSQRAGQGQLETVGEENAIGKVGQGIVDGGVGHQLAHGPPLGDVLDLADGVEGVAVGVPDEAGVQRGPDRVTVGVEVALLDLVVVDLTGQADASSTTG